MNVTTTCTTCGGELSGRASPLGALCPACVLRASCTPEPSTAGTLTTWAEVFPQLEVERTLREEEGLSIYLARVAGDDDGERAVLQVASGTPLQEAGGAAALTARADRLAACEIAGLAPVLDFGDLADAFFFVTGAPDLLTLPEAMEGKEAAEISQLVRAAAEEVEAITQAARVIGISLRFDPDLCFVEEDSGRVVQTPCLLVGEAQAEPAAPTNTKLGPGSHLGAFRLDEQIGEGGFGKVWRAHQERPVKRTVALKVLKSGLHSQRARARFEVEQQALAKLDHPHIARFFDGGTTPDGRPYFAMEWIDGQSVTRYSQQSGAPLSQRLELFHQACEAVQHAHQKGIIHRDLKSSNVMVTCREDHPTAKVIDFGIARAMEDPLSDRTQLTRAEEILGTPAAMSPEQAAGAGGSELDARTDVYGLGVLLYELLTGRLPFDPLLPPDDLRRTIREEDARKPSSRVSDLVQARPLKGDLDWITMRCLAKDPEDRYRSVSALLRDLERHTDHEPVEAGPPSLSYRVKKFVRRNRAMVAGSLVAVMALVVGLVLALSGFRQANIRAVEAQEAQEHAESEANTASEVTAFLQEHFFGQLNPENNPKSNLTLEDAVTHAAEALEAKPLDSPQVEGEIRMTLAESLNGLGRYREAEVHYRLAVDKLGMALGLEASPTVQARAKHAHVLSQLGQHQQACALQQRVVDHWSARRETGGQESMRARRDLAHYLMAAYRLRDGVKILENVFEEQRELLGINHHESLQSLAELSRFYGSVEKDFARAEELRRDLDVISIYREGSVDSIATLHLVQELSVSTYNFEVLETRLAAIENDEEASRLDGLRLQLEYAMVLGKKKGRTKKTIARCEPLLGDLASILGPTHPIVLEAYELLTWAMYRDGQREKIPDLVEPVLALLENEWANSAKFELLVRRYYGIFGMWEEATRYYTKAAPQLSLLKLSWGIAAAIASGDQGACDALQNEVLSRFGETDDPYAAAKIAECLLDGGLLNSVGTEPDFERIAHYVAIAHDQKPEWGKTRVAAMRLALARGDFETASHLAEQVAHGDRTKYDLFDRAWMRVARARCDAHLGDKSRVEIGLKDGELYWKISRDVRWIWWPPFVAIGVAWDQAEAEILGREVMGSRISPDRFGTSDSAYEKWNQALRGQALNNEGAAFTGAGRHEEALLRYQESLPLTEAWYGVGHPHTMLTRRNIAVSYWSLGRSLDAVRFLKETLAIPEIMKLGDGPALLKTRQLLGNVLVSEERHEEAVPILEDLIPRLEMQSQKDRQRLWLFRPDISIDDLAKAYAGIGEPEKASEMSAKVEGIRVNLFGVPLDANSPVVTEVLVPPTSTWRWLHPVDGVDPAKTDSDFHQTFFATNYDDSAWRTGRDSEGPTGGFGYGEERSTGVDIGAPEGDPNFEGKRNGKAAYFRHRFTTGKPHTKLELRCQRDDGIIVYLDGVEVARANMNEGEEGYLLPAVTGVGGEEETTIYRLPLTVPEGIQPGAHILAISLHNHSAASSDLRIGGITLVEVE